MATRLAAEVGQRQEEVWRLEAEVTRQRDEVRKLRADVDGKPLVPLLSFSQESMVGLFDIVGL